MTREPKVGDVIVEYTRDFKEVYLVHKVTRKRHRRFEEVLVHTLCWTPDRGKKPDPQTFRSDYFQIDDRVLVAENVGKHPANLLELGRSSAPSSDSREPSE